MARLAALKAKIGGGGGPFTSTDGKCALNPMILCDEDADCGAQRSTLPSRYVQPLP